MSSSGRTFFRRLSVQAFRNLSEVVCFPALGLNVISGQNGHGKTSLIEALYVLSTSRSFRCHRLGEVIQEGAERSVLSGETESFGLSHSLRAVISARGRSFQIDGKSPKRRLDYALATPVIAFVPADMSLCSGPAALRRTLLDRIIVYLDPGGAEARTAYHKASRERQRLLNERGPSARELEAYEQVLAESGARLARARRQAAERLLVSLGPAFSQMAAPELGSSFRYAPGGSEDAAEFKKNLADRRHRDLARGSMTYGPGRDDLCLEVEGRSAKSFASQGQQRLLTLALKVAELNCVREATCMEPMLLLDDVSSELDPERTAAVFRFLRQSRSQIFVTTTRPELFENVYSETGHRADFRMQQGQLIEDPKNSRIQQESC